ncbi:muts domain V-domain-containing protein [Lipomyces arxii]|uniref:muts domain V-domain-containing protein n=1 Tax=Lipomyces arxii TaxID=56418 RepID=UPI0034D0063C
MPGPQQAQQSLSRFFGSRPKPVDPVFESVPNVVAKTIETVQTALVHRDSLKRFASSAPSTAGPRTKRIRRSTPGETVRPRKAKLTAMVQQYVDIKKRHLDILLAVEVGYKFYFYGEDARVASSELNIFLVPGWNSVAEAEALDDRFDKFASAMVPVPRIYVHVRRLIEKGYKVGLVRQTETAALKAAGANKAGPFARELTEVYTKGTFVDDGESGGVVFGICEAACRDGVVIGMVAVVPSTGRVVYDEFKDGFMRAELETRLLHLPPCEIVVVGEVSSQTEKVLKRVDARSETVDRISADDGDLPELVRVCVASMTAYMAQYNLDRVFSLTANFEDFKSQSCMALPSNTLSSLAIFSSDDGVIKGSLFWLMDHTRTRFGQRMLRTWIGSPLTDLARLEIRVGAVDEIMHSTSDLWQRVVGLLAKLPDLENGLVRIHYGRSTRSDVLLILRAFERIGRELAVEPTLRSELLNGCFKVLPTMATQVANFLDAIECDAAVKNDKYHFFKSEDAYPDIEDNKMGILQIETELDSFLIRARKEINKSYMKYSTVAGTEYVIELRNTELRGLPKTWIKISGTKQVSRFHPPEVVALLREREERRESLSLACDVAFRSFLSDIATCYVGLKDIVVALATLDCLLSLVAVSRLPGYVKPEFVDRTCVEVRSGRHPMVEQVSADAFVPNDVCLGDDIRAVVLTGPNMGGKSCYVRQTALIAIMAQVGSYVPAKSARLGLVDGVYTRMGANDNMQAGESTFMVELDQIADIMRSATSRSLVLLDEVGRGTGPVDGSAIAGAVLSYFVSDVKSLTLFVTHYPGVCAETDESVGKYYMAYKHTDDGVSFLYEAVRGVASRSYGLNVARLAGLPDEVVQVAEVKAAEIEDREKAVVARDAFLRQDVEFLSKLE